MQRKGQTGHQTVGGGYRAAEVGGGGGSSGGGTKKVVGGPGRGDGKPVACSEAV